MNTPVIIMTRAHSLQHTKCYFSLQTKSTQRWRLHYKRSSSRKEVGGVQDSDGVEDGAVTDEANESIDDVGVDVESEL